MSAHPTTFFKYHGTGNDFVVVDARTVGFDVEALTPAICDRHRGVGADGVIVVDVDGAPRGFDARMTIFNRDGSRPQMCGNGIRCVARHLVEVLGHERHLRIATDAGERRCEVYVDGDRWEVDVDMGIPQMTGQATVQVAADALALTGVDMGNPHAVTFESRPPGEVDAIGALLNAPQSPYPQGVNVEFVTITGDSRLDVVVYERGVGRTQACGTGACAAAVAAWQQERVRGAEVEVWLPGGPLRIRSVADHVWMRGDAEFVMRGELGPGWLRERTSRV